MLSNATLATCASGACLLSLRALNIFGLLITMIVRVRSPILAIFLSSMRSIHEYRRQFLTLSQPCHKTLAYCSTKTTLLALFQTNDDDDANPKVLLGVGPWPGIESATVHIASFALPCRRHQCCNELSLTRVASSCYIQDDHSNGKHVRPPLIHRQVTGALFVLGLDMF